MERSTADGTSTRAHRVALLVGSVGLSAAVYVGACAYVWATQVEQIFKPQATLQSTPARVGLVCDEAVIPLGNGREEGTLSGFWVPADSANAPAFLYLHGNDATIGKNLDHARQLHELGYHVLLAEYRGFGKDFAAGPPSEAKVYADAEAAWRYLIRVRGVKPQQAFIYGHSLGGAIAIELAVRHPEAAGLIAESTFTSLPAVARLQYYGLTRLLPIDFLVLHRFESLQKIRAIKIPVLLIHGTWDKKVPCGMTEELYAAAPQPKELLLIEGGEHGNSASVGWVEYGSKVTAFVRERLTPARSRQVGAARGSRRV
jgi:uncharacterized protein